MDARLHQMLSELRQALYDAIADSRDVHRTWRQLHDEGYALYIVLDCRRQDETDEETAEAPALRGGDPDPSFRINGGDLSFLRSIGIDPTRRVRRRRSQG